MSKQVEKPKDKCKGCNNVKGCITCVDGSEWAHIEECVSNDFEEALAQEWKGYNDRGAATVDALEDNTQELAFAKGFYHGWHHRKEEPVSSIWHDSNKEQPNYASTVAIWNPKYKNGEIISRCTEVYSDRIWAYIDDLLKI